MPRTIAFYLPQFHQIAENDAWWGEGFTEWSNVRRAEPLFESHSHPRVSTVLGEYDLTDAAVYEEQTELARSAGVDGFCMYFYWFGGHRLLEKPIDAWRDNPELLPYCLSWANESWTRRWDGKSKSVLIAQDYEDGYAERLFKDLLPHFEAPHYLKQDGLPILLVHRAQAIPRPREFADTLQKLAVVAGLGGIHLVMSETTSGAAPAPLGFDAVAEFPPVGANTLASAQIRPLKNVKPGFRGRLMSYPRMSARFQRRQQPAFVRYSGVAPGWDNTARRKAAATVYVGASPEKYASWLNSAQKLEQQVRGSRGIVFINAWNEWAEGAYLEPDIEHGDEYIRATSSPSSFRPDRHPGQVAFARFWSVPQLRSIALAAAGSVLALVRGVKARARMILPR